MGKEIWGGRHYVRNGIGNANTGQYGECPSVAEREIWHRSGGLDNQV